MTSQDVLDRLAVEARLWLTTLRPDGSPHTTPVWFVHVRGRVWFACAAQSIKLRNLRADPRVSLALEDGTRPAVAEGVADLVHAATAPEQSDVVAALSAKYAGWDVREPERPGVERVLVRVSLSRWLLAGTAQ